MAICKVENVDLLKPNQTLSLRTQATLQSNLSNSRTSNLSYNPLKDGF